MKDVDTQMEFDFSMAVCRCNENTSYEDLCPVCLADCLEYLASTDEDLYGDLT